MPERKPFTLDRVVRLVITIVIVLGVIWLINYLKDVLLPFCVACLIAYILEPFVQYNRRLFGLKGRVLAVLITLFETATLIGVLCVFFVPRVVDEFHEIARVFQNYAAGAVSIAYLPDEIHAYLSEYINFQDISETILNGEWMSMAERAISTTWGIITSGFSLVLSIFSWFITVLYVIFIMIDYERLLRGVKNLVPVKYKPIVFRIATDVRDSMNHYFRGQALVAFIVGVLFSIGFLIIGLPLAVVLGMFIGLLNMVPYLQLVSIIPTTLLCLVYAAGGGGGNFWTIFLESMAVYCIVQAIQDLILTPKIMGKAMGLNPAIILLSLSVWGSLLGFIGLIIALPLTTLIISYYDRYIIQNDKDLSDSEKRKEESLINKITKMRYDK